MKSPHRAKKVKKIKRLRKWKKRSVIIFSSFLFLIVLLVVLIYTSLGVKIASTVLNKVMPELHIEQLDGSFSDLEVTGFSLVQNGIEIKVDKASLSLSALCLFEGKLCVQNLAASDVTVNIDTLALSASEQAPTKDISETTQRLTISTPLPLELTKLQLSNVTVSVDKMRFGLSSFQGKVNWINERIYVLPSKAMGIYASLPESSSNTALTKLKTDDVIHQSINKAINDIFNKPLISSLPNVNIPLDIFVNQLTGSDWKLDLGKDHYQFDNITIRARIIDSLIYIRQLKTDAKTPFISGNVVVNGSIKLKETWQIAANLDIKTLPQGKQVATIIKGKVRGQLLGKLSADLSLTGLNNAVAHTQIDFIENYLPIKLDVNGQHIQWPLSGQANYQLNDFLVDLSGSVKEYRLNSHGSFIGTDLPDSSFSVLARGTNKSISYKASITLPQGKVAFDGDVGWNNELIWYINGKIDQLDLVQTLPDYPIELNGSLIISGKISDDYWSVALAHTDLQGTFDGEPLLIKVERLLATADEQIRAYDTVISLGKNQIKVNGSTHDDDFLVDIQMTQPELITPLIKGNITGQIQLKNSFIHPQIETDITINRFSIQEIAIEKATLKGEINYQSLLSGEVLLHAERVSLPALMVDRADIKLTGDENHHQIKAFINGEPVSLNTTLTGHLNRSRTKWQGSLSDSAFILSEKNKWALNKDINIDYDFAKSIINIDAHCWINQQSKLCLDNDLIVAQSGEVKLSLTDIELSQFNIVTGIDTQLGGLIQGKANIKWDPNNVLPIITAKIDSDNVHIKQALTSQSLTIPFDQFTITTDINDKIVKLNWNFSLKEYGKIKGNIEVIKPSTTKTLSGTLDIDKLSLSIANSLLESNEHADGFINGHLKLSGTLIDPYITGDIDLSDSEIKASQLPVDVQSLALNVHFSGKSSKLQGVMQTGSGNIDIDGQASWQDINNWTAAVSAKGAEMALNLPPMIKLHVKPDISIEANQDELTLKGKIEIPRGRITIESLPASSVSVSSDEVMLDDNLQEITTQNLGMKINSRVQVILGDRVFVDAFGLVARLSGGIYASQTEKGMNLIGQINIPEGRFHAYGQDLIIQKGEVTFAGPADQPRLNIEAIRNPESIENNVTAGIRVTGVVDNTQVEIFSDPAMSQQEALSYLLRGQGLDSAEQSDNDMMTALLIGFGASQGGKFIGDIGNAFGIRNLSLDTQGVGENSKVVVSGYILPNLQLKYGVGIFDNLATFTLRYRLMPKLYLEAISGLDQSVDLLYQFEL